MSSFSIVAVIVAGLMIFLVFAVKEHERQERLKKERRKAEYLDKAVEQITGQPPR